MGQSTNAILFYGFHVDEDFQLPWGEDTDFEDSDDWLDAQAGIDQSKSPWKKLPDGLSWQEQSVWCDKHITKLDAWSVKKEKARAKLPKVAVCRHCSGDYPMPYFRSVQTVAMRGYVERIENLEKPDRADAELAKFAAMLGVTEPDIGWFLVSYWG